MSKPAQLYYACVTMRLDINSKSPSAYDIDIEPFVDQWPRGGDNELTPLSTWNNVRSYVGVFDSRDDARDAVAEFIYGPHHPSSRRILNATGDYIYIRSGKLVK